MIVIFLVIHKRHNTSIMTSAEDHGDIVDSTNAQGG
jgi:hypothetical protein